MFSSSQYLLVRGIPNPVISNHRSDYSSLLTMGLPEAGIHHARRKWNRGSESYRAVNGYDTANNLGEREEEIWESREATPITTLPHGSTPLQEEHTYASELTGSGEINSYDSAASPCLFPGWELVGARGVVAEPSASAVPIVRHSEDYRSPLQDSDTQTYSCYGTWTPGGISDTAGILQSFPQRVIQPTPMLQYSATVFGRVGSNIVEHGLPLPVSLPGYHDQAEGQTRGSSTVLHSDQNFCYTGEQGFRDMGGVSLSLLGNMIQTNSVITGEPISPGSIDPSSLPFLVGMGDEKTIGLPTWAPLPGTNDIEIREAGRAMLEDGSSEVECPPRLQQGPTQPTLPSPPELRIVPQDKYKCANSQGDWNRIPDIHFRVKGTEGIKLTDAMNIHFDGPDGRDDPMFTDDNVGNSVSCRIAFQGCRPCRARQIVTTNHKKERARITRKKLAEYVAKRIKMYLEDLKDHGTPCPIHFEDMVLTRLVRVAQASWQPEVWHQVVSSGSIST